MHPVRGVLAFDEALDVAVILADGLPVGGKALPLREGSVPENRDPLFWHGHTQNGSLAVVECLAGRALGARELPEAFYRHSPRPASGAWMEITPPVGPVRAGGVLLEASGEVVGTLRSGLDVWNRANLGLGSPGIARLLSSAKSADVRPLASFSQPARDFADILKHFHGDFTKNGDYPVGSPPRSRYLVAVTNLLSLAEANRGLGVELDAWLAVLVLGGDPDAPRDLESHVRVALDGMQERYRDDHRLAAFLSERHVFASPATRDFLRRLGESSGASSVRQLAALSLACELERGREPTGEALRQARLALEGSALYSDGGNDDSIWRDRSTRPEFLSRSTAKAQPASRYASNLVARLTHLVPGALAPTLEGRDARGGKTSLASFRGRPVVLGLWSRHDEQAGAAVEALAAWSRQCQDPTPAFVGVTLDDPGATVPLADNTSAGWTHWRDSPEGSVRAGWPLLRTPVFFILATNGVVDARIEDHPRENILTFRDLGGIAERRGGDGWRSPMQRALVERGWSGRPNPAPVPPADWPYAAVGQGQLGSSLDWQSLSFPAARGRYLCLEALDSQDGDGHTVVAEVEARDGSGVKLDPSGWRVVYATSEETKGEQAPAGKALDGDPATFWHTRWSLKPYPPRPHRLILDLGEEQTLSAVRLLHRKLNRLGRVRTLRVYLEKEPFALPKNPGVPSPRNPGVNNAEDPLASFCMRHPWLSSGWWGKRERTVFLRAGGTTSVGWISHWEARPPSGLHLHVEKVGCVDLEVDTATGLARVTSPASLAGRTMRQRVSSAEDALPLDAYKRIRDAMLAEPWRVFGKGRVGIDEPVELRLRLDGTTDEKSLPAWELLPSGVLRLYREDGMFWNYRLDLEKKTGFSFFAADRNDAADGDVADARAIAAGDAACRLRPDLEGLPAVLSATCANRTGWQSWSFESVSARYVCLEILGSHGGEPVSTLAEIGLIGESGRPLPTQEWKDAYSTTEPIGEVAPQLAWDGKHTFWQTPLARRAAPRPHFLVIDLGSLQTVAGLRLLQREDSPAGRIKEFRLYARGDAFPLR